MKTKKIGILLLSFMMSTSSVCYAHDHSTHAHGDTESHSSHPSEEKQNTGPTLKITLHKLEDRGDKKFVQVKLSKIKDDKAITLDDLKEVHTQKVHLFTIDSSLKDYSHIHPKALPEAGLYEFEWNPKTKSSYQIWGDLFPLDTDTQEYVHSDLVKSKAEKSEINRTVTLESKIEGYTFKLSLESKNLVVGTPTLGKIAVSDDKGNPVKDLEPVMGAFGHIVGFTEDRKTVVHIHPMGEEPSKPTDRGGPELQFHITPEKKGFIKLFAQVSIKGKEMFAPFGVIVE